MLRWGVLGTAKIAREKVIPGIQASETNSVIAIGSRNESNSVALSKELEIPKAFGSYEEVIAEEDVDAVYIPLPNDLHLEWTIKAAEAGKHVLCEKPIALNVAEVDSLIECQKTSNVLISEGFMIRSHPLWKIVIDSIRKGEIGDVRSIVSLFSYHNTDGSNIRNMPEHGGGALYDIGCYCVYISRWIFGSEPTRIQSAIEKSTEFGVDDLTSGVLEFEQGHAIFTCSTRLVPQQSVRILGTEGTIEIPIPFNIPRGLETKYFIDKLGARDGSTREEVRIDVCDQYRTQADQFEKDVEKGDYTSHLLDSRKNMTVIDSIFKNA